MVVQAAVRRAASTRVAPARRSAVKNATIPRYAGVSCGGVAVGGLVTGPGISVLSVLSVVSVVSAGGVGGVGGVNDPGDVPPVVHVAGGGYVTVVGEGGVDVGDPVRPEGPFGDSAVTVELERGEPRAGGAGGEWVDGAAEPAQAAGGGGFQGVFPVFRGHGAGR